MKYVNKREISVYLQYVDLDITYNYEKQYYDHVPSYSVTLPRVSR